MNLHAIIFPTSNVPFLHLPTTVGSKSTKTARGTCFPAPVSLKNVLNESSPPPIVLSHGICPSGWIPCSRQYNSQQALPIWTPACPTWTEMHSRYNKNENFQWRHMQISFCNIYSLPCCCCFCVPMEKKWKNSLQFVVDQMRPWQLPKLIVPGSF